MAFIYDMVDEWNDNGVVFNAVRMSVTDTTSAAGSLLFDFRRNNVSVLSLGKDNVLSGGPTSFSNISFSNWWSASQSANGGIGFGQGHIIVWATGGNPNGNVADSMLGRGDVGLARNGVGVLEVNDSNLGVLTTLYARNLRTLPMTFASLMTAASVGAGGRAFITDGAAATFNTTAAGGGANAVPVFSDGTQWRVG